MNERESRQLPRKLSPITYKAALSRARSDLRANFNYYLEKMWFDSTEVDTSDVAEDSRALTAQNEALRRIDAPAIVVTARQNGKRVRVPVHLDLGRHSSVTDYHQSIEAVALWGLTVETVSVDESQRLFIDLAADFIALRASTIGSGSPPTSVVTVATTRSGDSIIYARGYFYSTRLSFGTSTPATRTLPNGRYDFGIWLNSSAQWSGLLHTAPSVAPIHVALP